MRFNSSIPLFAIVMAGSTGFPDCEWDCGCEEGPGRSSSSPELKGDKVGSLMSIVWGTCKVPVQKYVDVCSWWCVEGRMWYVVCGVYTLYGGGKAFEVGFAPNKIN